MVTDIRMSFWSMVVFMVKWALASIPALFILLVVIFYYRRHAAAHGSRGCTPDLAQPPRRRARRPALARLR
ncbi:MAG: hypothetical protein MZW92_10740 [Comamonadaceae bacterium]|nr:hypothetical protein [Comamonadaceae bacterium]